MRSLYDLDAVSHPGSLAKGGLNAHTVNPSKLPLPSRDQIVFAVAVIGAIVGVHGLVTGYITI